MAKTYGELILEYENFQHSKEHFELMKECYEIELMNQYVESQQFMVENMAEIREEYKEFDESYFIEATDENTAKSIAKTAAEKKDGFMKNMGQKIMSAIEKIKGFFIRIFENMRRSFANLDKFEGKYKGKIKSVDEMGAEKLASAVKNAWPQKYIDDGFEIAALGKPDVDPEWKVLINGIKDKKTKGAIIAALSKNGVKIRLMPKTGSNSYPQVMDADTFTVNVNRLGFGRGSSEPASTKAEETYIFNVSNMFTRGIAKGSIDIDLADTNLKEITEQLKQVDAKLKGMAETEGQPVSNYNGTEAMKLYNTLLAISADTMKMYTYIFNYRKDVLIQLTKSFDELLKDVKKEDPKVEEEAKQEPKEDK